MPSFNSYKRRLQSSKKYIKEQRRRAADLNNELAWELADGHQDATILTRNQVDDNIHEWYDSEILVRHTLTGQEKKIITKPYVDLPIGSYVKYNDKICIVRENLLDENDVMPSYKAYICTWVLKLKGCPFEFPVYSFNSSYSSVGLADYDKVLGLDSRNKIYIQKNKYTVRLFRHHRNYRIILGDDETKYYYFITEMDDTSYPGMFVISLKVDEQHPNDNGFYAYNENVIDFSDLYLEIPGEPEDEPTNVSAPTISCGTYYKVKDIITIECNNEIALCEVNDYDIVSLREETKKVYSALCLKAGLLTIAVTDVYGNVVTKNVIIK